jgi:N-acetylmuramic acid 6-phosphate etherase
MQSDNTTESSSNYQHLEKMTTFELLQNMNQEDKTVPLAVERAIPQVEKVVEIAHASLQNGGRLFYIGAGTSGRLGIVDASECPPTFGVPHSLVNGIIAGGDTAIRKAVEFAEDDTEQGYKDLLAEGIQAGDMLIGIAASGSTPYVIGAVKEARRNGIHTACIVCNAGSRLSAEVEHAIEVVVGPEFVTGSTRMKSGTAQKLVLNMISTSVLIKMGRVKGNKMVDMQLSNHKLVNRGTRMIMEEISVDEATASALLHEHGSVRAAVEAYNKK